MTTGAKAGLRSRLTLLIGFLITICLLTAALGVWTLQHVLTRYERIAKVILPSVEITARLSGNARDITRNVIRLALNGNTPAELAHVLGKLKTLDEQYRANKKEFEALPRDPEWDAVYAKMDVAWGVFSAEAATTAAMLQSTVPAERERGITRMNSLFRKSYEGMFDAIKALNAYQSQLSNDKVKEASSLAHTAMQSEAWIAILASLIGIAVGTLFSKRLLDVMRALTGRLTQSADQLRGTAVNSARISETLSSAAQQTSASLGEAASSLTEINAMVQQNEQSTTQSNRVAAETAATAQAASAAVQRLSESQQRVQESHRDIQKAVNENLLELERLTKLIGEIAAKTKVIDDIVFQTKLLSFNASVEAARAGENGKGFAVVAEEVGSLAIMSGNAAREIAQMLQASREQVELAAATSKIQIERLLQSGDAQLETSGKDIESCQKILHDLAGKVAQAGQLMESIAEASREQATGVQTVTAAIEQLETASHQNSQSADQSAASSHTLKTQANALHELVHLLETSVNGAHAKTEPTPKTPPKSGLRLAA